MDGVTNSAVVHLVKSQPFQNSRLISIENPLQWDDNHPIVTESALISFNFVSVVTVLGSICLSASSIGVNQARYCADATPATAEDCLPA